jgi:RecA-family ATPase
MEIQFVEHPSLPPERAEKLRQILDDVRIAPPSEKLTAFGRAARRTAREIVGPTYPLREAVDRLWTTAEVHGLLDECDANIIQTELAAAFEPGDDDDDQLIGQSLREEPAPPRSRDAPIVPATFITPAAWPDEAPPPVDWLVAGRIPRGDVTTLHGDGGTGKTDIATLLAANVARGAQEWLGHDIAQGPGIFISGEEHENAIRRKVWMHAQRDGYSMQSLTDLHLWFPAEGGDTVLALPDQSGIMRPTRLMDEICERIARLAPAFVAVDNVAATYGGNQIDRLMARSYVNLFRTVAQGPGNPAVLLLDHPSLSGLSNGSGRGGNMDWRNSVRSALYMHNTDDKAEADRGVKILETAKNNYGPLGKPARLVWGGYGFQLERTPSSLGQVANDAQCDEMFLRLLDERNDQRRDVSDKASITYAPKVFSEMDNNGGFSNREFARAMERLFRARKITLEKVGPPSDLRKRIVRPAPASVMEAAE